MVYGPWSGYRAVLDALIGVERQLWSVWSPRLIVLLDRDRPMERDEDMDRWSRLRAVYLAMADREGDLTKVAVVRNTAGVRETISTIEAALEKIGLRVSSRGVEAVPKQ